MMKTTAGKNGFSLVELLITLAIVSVVTGVIVTTFVIQQRTYDAQGQVTEMVQNVRAATDLMTKEIQMAGYDPSGSGFSGINFSAAQIEIYADNNGDGDRNDADESIMYTYDSDQSIVYRDAGTGMVTVAENIEALALDYLDNGGNPTANANDVRQIRLLITGRTDKPDPKFTQNNGFRTYTVTTVIFPKNLGWH